jgi:hypothetical protein
MQKMKDTILSALLVLFKFHITVFSKSDHLVLVGVGSIDGIRDRM